MNILRLTLTTLRRAPAVQRAALLSVVALSALSFTQHAAAQAAAYQITLTNLTSAAQTEGAPSTQTGQRLSPPVFVTHSSAYNMYTLGQAAPETIWRIAESGDRSFLLNEVKGLMGTSVLSVQAPLSAPLPQQQSVTVTVQANAANRFLSFASMLGSSTKISPERALEKLRRIQHQRVKVNDMEPIAALSSINQDHTDILHALTIKKPTLPAQLTLL